MAAVPIWKDYYVNLSGKFRIVVSETGEVIYEGKANARPGAGIGSVRINDICADYLENVLPTLSQSKFTRMGNPTFIVQLNVSGTSATGTWQNIATVQFYNDWSYDYDFNPATMGLSFPINGVVDARMPIVYTGYEVSEVYATIYFKDGHSIYVIVPVKISPDFNADFNNDFAKSVRSSGSGTAVFFPDGWPNVTKIVIGKTTFNIVQSCARYALYYVNAYGGWDCFLIEGNTMESDSLKRYTREAVYDNRSIQNRGIYNYMNEITKSFQFHTGWLTGEQGEKMHHLVNSTQVYMYDMAKRQMIPVIIPSTSCEYKNFKNNGNKLVNYTLQVQVAQNRIRR